MNRAEKFINDVISEGLSKGIPIQEIFRQQSATEFDIKMYNYFEKFNMYLMQKLLEKGILDKREIIELFANAMRSAGEPEDHVQQQIVQLKGIYRLG